MSEQHEYQVTARKWRPAEFDSVVGQEHVTQTLKNAIKSGRLHHAYLFTGPRGVGKTTTARILAKALNCENLSEEFEPCNACDSCRSIVEGRSMDVVEIDGASNNSVDDVRKLRDNAKYPPVNGRYKLYVIDEVHMLSTSAFNALLKTLEEPPKHLIFVFATTEPHKVPATILSRCQRFDFRRMQIDDIVRHLAYIAGRESITIDEDALIVIARKADGSMRDAQSIFDQVVSFCGMSVTYQQANDALNLIDQEFFFRVTDMMRSHDPADAFAIVEQIMRSGYDIQEFLIGLSEHFRNFLTVLSTGSTALIEAARAIKDRYADEARSMEQGDVIRALHLTLAAQQAIRMASQPRLRLELALIQLAVMDSTVSLGALLEKIDRMPEGGFPSPAPSSSASPAATARGSSAAAGISPSGTPGFSPGSASNASPGSRAAPNASPSASPSAASSAASNAASNASPGSHAAPSALPSASPGSNAAPGASPSAASNAASNASPGSHAAPATDASSATSSASTASAALTGRVAEPSAAPNGAAGATNGDTPSKRSSDLTDIASFPTAPPPGRASASAAESPAIANDRVARTNRDSSLSATISGAARGAAPSISQIQSRWSEFRRACDDRRTLAVVLEQIEPAEITGGTIRLYVADDSQRTMIARSRDVLAERLTSFFGSSLTVEAVVGAAPVMRTESRSVTNGGERESEHPFIKALVEHLGATKL